MGVPLGKWSQLRNVRWCGDAAITVAAGPSAGVEVVAGGTPRGLFSGYVNGAYVLVAAMRVSGTTRVYYSSDDGVTWAEFTTPAGYTNYRFSTDGRVEFAVARHPGRTTNPDLLVAVNGSDTPRVFDYSATYGYIHDEIAADDAIQLAPVTLSPRNYFNIQGTTTHTNSGGGISGAATGSSPNLEERITVANTVVSGDFCTLQYTATVSFTATASRQLWVLMETQYPEFVGNCQVSLLTSGGTEYNVYNPYATNYDSYQAPVRVEYGAKGRFLVCYDLSHLESIGTVTLDRIRFTWKGPAPSASRTVDIQCIAFSGLLQGVTSVGQVRFNSATLSSSPSVVYANYQGARLRECGGPVDKQSRLPISTAMYYIFNVPYTNVSAGELGKGVDQVRLFIRRPGESLYRYATATTTGSPSAGTFTSGTASKRDATAITLSTRQASNYEYLMPSAFHQSIPKGYCATSAGGRLLIGAKDTSDYPGGVYFSEQGNSFHFLVSPDSDLLDTSATSIQFPNELPQTFLQNSVSSFGSSSVYFWTNQSLYAFSVVGVTDILRFSKLGPHGTVHPMSVAEHKTGVYWLDADNQVRRLGGQIENLSQFVVDDLLDEANTVLSTNPCGAQGFTIGDRYYLAVCPTTDPIVTKNYSTLVYHTNLGAWESEDRTSSSRDIGCAAVHFNGIAKTARFISATDAKFRTYEGDTSTAVSWSLQTGALHSFPTPYGEFVVNRINAIFDKHSGSMTSSRSYQPGGGSMPGTYTVTGSGIQWANDTLGSASGTARGRTCQITISGSAAPGKKIYGLYADVEARSGNPVAS